MLWPAGVTILGLLFAVHCQPLSRRRQTPELPVTAAGGFDAVRAFADLKHLVDFGPRPAGSKNAVELRGSFRHRGNGQG